VVELAIYDHVQLCIEERGETSQKTRWERKKKNEKKLTFVLV